MAEPPESNGNAGNDNPFQVEADAGDRDPPAVLPDAPAAPPAYNEAVQINSSPPVQHMAPRAAARTPPTTALEHTPLLPLQEIVSEHLNHERRQKGVTRALLLWLGIGQWYSGVCIFISFAFFAGGGVIVILSAITLDSLQQVKITTFAAGLLFILLSILWPCTWLWNQWNKTCGCSYIPLIGYVWLLSLLYTTVVGALVSGVDEHYSCVHFCKNCTFTPSNRYPCDFVAMSLWTLTAMVALMLGFILANIVCCCCYTFKGNRQYRYV